MCTSGTLELGNGIASWGSSTMKILQLLKHDLRDERDKWARCYRQMRKDNPAKARMLFRRIRVATALTEASLHANLIKNTEV